MNAIVTCMFLLLGLKEACVSTKSSDEIHASASDKTVNAAGSVSGMTRSTPIQGTSESCTSPKSRSSSQDTFMTSSSEWHVNFNIPDVSAFSGCVQEAIRTGVVTAKARREINLILRTYIVAHTVYPSSEQYNTVCRKLVTKFPNLRDTEPGKSLYVSFQ